MKTENLIISYTLLIFADFFINHEEWFLSERKINGAHAISAYDNVTRRKQDKVASYFGPMQISPHPPQKMKSF